MLLPKRNALLHIIGRKLGSCLPRKALLDARGVLGRHRGPKGLALEYSSTIASLGPALFPTKCCPSGETAHWFSRANVSHDSGDICQLRLSADRRPDYSAT